MLGPAGPSNITPQRNVCPVFDESKDATASKAGQPSTPVVSCMETELQFADCKPSEGLLIIAFHQYWSSVAAVLITLFGWILALRGLVLMAAPKLYERAVASGSDFALQTPTLTADCAITD
jgi:hypothetical protein